MGSLVAFVLAVLALPTPLMGFGAYLGVAVQGVALLLALRTLFAWPADAPRHVRFALAALGLIAAPWMLTVSAALLRVWF